MAFPATTTRYLLFLCNLIFLVSALAVAVIAILIQLSLFHLDYFVDANLSSPLIIIVIACGIICLVSFCGCCGVIKENRCCLYLFSVLLFVVVIGEIFASVYVFSTKDQISKELKMKMLDSMQEYNKTEVVTRSWDVLQHDFHCCGVQNATDWTRIKAVKGKLPHSCCLDLSIKMECTIKDANKAGCFSGFAQFLHGKTLTLAAVVLGVGVAQLLCAIASGLLARHIRERYEAV